MKISGFTFIRNGVQLGYPFVASIRSLLPLCHEVIINVPRSTDDTLKIIREIGDPKIRIIESDWDDTPQSGGRGLSQHTNLALEQCTGDWCVYIQADEVLHEDSVKAMKIQMVRELHNPRVQGLLVDFTHFYGSFWTEVYSFGWYYKEIRIVRRDAAIRSCGDAQGFRTTEGQKLRVKSSGGKYFHYGHALEPGQARIKCANLESLYSVPKEKEKNNSVAARCPERFYEDDQKVKPFKGTHPDVMRETVAAANWTYHSRKPLIRMRRNYFWEDVAMLVKACTGITFGVHKNYKLIE